MSKFKRSLTTLLALSFAGSLLWLSYRLLVFAYRVLASLDSNVAVAVVASSTTILASTLTVVISRYYQTKREQELAHRDKKIELYDKFLQKLFKIFLATDEKEREKEAKNLIPFLREIQRQLILWSGADAIKAYADWHKVLTTSPPCARQMIKMIDFFLALRRDLGHSNRGIDHSHMVRFLLRNSDLFMREYRKNPQVTLSEIVGVEEHLGLVSEFKDNPSLGSIGKQ